MATRKARSPWRTPNNPGFRHATEAWRIPNSYSNSSPSFRQPPPETWRATKPGFSQPTVLSQTDAGDRRVSRWYRTPAYEDSPTAPPPSATRQSGTSKGFVGFMNDAKRRVPPPLNTQSPPWNRAGREDAYGEDEFGDDKQLY